jgi:hypothetical protein
MADSMQEIAAREADAVTAAMDKKIAASADCGMGTVSVINPGGLTGTVSVDLSSGGTIIMRRSSGYTPTVGDKVKWSRSQVGDWFCDYKLA